jgi:hypothetical protein
MFSENVLLAFAVELKKKGTEFLSSYLDLTPILQAPGHRPAVLNV